MYQSQVKYRVCAQPDMGAEEGAARPQAVQSSCPEEDDDDDTESVAGASGAANGRPTAQRAGRGEP